MNQISAMKNLPLENLEGEIVIIEQFKYFISCIEAIIFPVMQGNPDFFSNKKFDGRFTGMVHYTVRTLEPDMISPQQIREVDLQHCVAIDFLCDEESGYAEYYFTQDRYGYYKVLVGGTIVARLCCSVQDGTFRIYAFNKETGWECKNRFKNDEPGKLFIQLIELISKYGDTESPDKFEIQEQKKEDGWMELLHNREWMKFLEKARKFFFP